ncbi:enoyl-CoA hydratase/isomerase family protein [Enemella sp. A6]|uniref:enoyl-CoA hydratase/isomerase family protein n=1 Tax=Enemella sp. A6 TaxID=3440152 RepID=UPI003EBC19AA
MSANTEQFGEHVIVEVADGVGTLRLARPKVNALNIEMQESLGRAAEYLNRAEDVSAVVITGGDRVFAAGADIKEMVEYDTAGMMQVAERTGPAFDALAGIGKPVVAAINGYALGGGLEVALCADWRIAGTQAKLGFPEVLLGVVPGLGGTQRLPRLVGVSKAKELIFTGRHVDAEEALRIGLVDQVVADEDVQQTALDWAKQFTGSASLALRAAKETIDSGLDGSLADGLALERTIFAELFDTDDRTIGMTSFMNEGPGKATFTGR